MSRGAPRSGTAAPSFEIIPMTQQLNHLSFTSLPNPPLKGVQGL